MSELQGMFLPLESEQAQRLLSQSDAHAKDLNKAAWIDWQALYDYFTSELRYEEPLFMHGKRFNFEPANAELAFVQIRDGLAPCGWFTLTEARKHLQTVEAVELHG